jgi:hypothetical protein
MKKNRPSLPPNFAQKRTMRFWKAAQDGYIKSHREQQPQPQKQASQQPYLNLIYELKRKKPTNKTN